jgi:hypothetical protein
MAATIKHANGHGDETGVSITGTATLNHLVYGPPPSGRPQTKGVFILQSGSAANGTYRALEEIWTPGTASPSGYTFV